MLAGLDLKSHREDIEAGGAVIVFEEDLQDVALLFRYVNYLHLRASRLRNWEIEKRFLAGQFGLCEGILDLAGFKPGVKEDEDDCALDDVDAKNWL